MPPLNEWDDLRPLAPISLSDSQWDQLQKLHTLLVETNAKINLTRLTDLPDFLSGHVLDSLQLTSIIEAKKPTRILDVGSGGGFPALILAITYPDIEVSALDSVGKKMTAVAEMASGLGLTNLTTIIGRAEDLGAKSAYREQYDMVVARAVADLSRLMEYCSPFTRLDGHFVAMKTHASLTSELPQSLNAQRQLGLSHLETVDASASGLMEGHNLMVFGKHQAIPEGYPRRTPMIQKHPL